MYAFHFYDHAVGGLQCLSQHYICVRCNLLVSRISRVLGQERNLIDGFDSSLRCVALKVHSGGLHLLYSFGSKPSERPAYS